MTEYEVYSYEAFRKKYQDDIRPVYRATMLSLNQELLSRYIQLLKNGKPNLSAIQDVDIVVPGNEMGQLGEAGERFVDNQWIEGSIPDI